MKTYCEMIAATLIGFAPLPATSAVSASPIVQSDILEHGGGCRKSSPPGQCCHKDHSTGIVHCH